MKRSTEKQHQKSGGGDSHQLRDHLANLKEVARAALSENGEDPDHWIMAGSEEGGKIRFFCGSPPFSLTDEPDSPLLSNSLSANIGLALRLTVERGESESMVCASFGFLGNLLCEESFDSEDFPAGYVMKTQLRRRDQPIQAMRVAMQEMVRLGWAAGSQLSVISYPSGTGHKSQGVLRVRSDGGLAMQHFEGDMTLGQLSEAMGSTAAKAKLVRMRQTAKNCGGCGRCCHDPDIPLTYFDVGSVATHRFADLYDHNPAAALARASEMLAFPKPTNSLLSAPRLYFRKRDSTSGANSPCIFLDGRGLCGVYTGRPLLCRLYHCADPSIAVENLYKSAFYTLEWLGRVIESGLLHPARPITLPALLELPLVKLASPYALQKVAEEVANPK
ncbi:MAG: YkgJ family cysteine cluster protein [Chloroflexota bacterium]|nr:YkgJ family cysteine cluster protein [Chloroflexota bacterium]